MVFFAPHAKRADAVRASWRQLRPGGSFFATASLADAVLSALGTPGTLVVVDAEATDEATWRPLLRHLRRNAPELPVLVFGSPAGHPWEALDSRLRERLEMTP